jgi:hypothetical protein
LVSFRRGSQPVQHDSQDGRIERVEEESEGIGCGIAELRGVGMNDQGILNPTGGEVPLGSPAQRG